MSIPHDHAELANRFASVARRYCGIVDATPSLDRPELLMEVYRILPQLISEAIALPNLELGDDGNQEQEAWSPASAWAQFSRAEWQQLYDLLKGKLGDWNLYWQVWDPTKENQAIQGSLADDIADIYGDLKRGLVLSEARDALPENSIWHWRFGYFSHWGKHAINALNVVHCILDDHFLIDEPLR